VTNGSISYVSGSFNYGNTPALRFATGPNSIVIPDTATGNFTFTNSFTMEAVVRSTNNTSTTGAILAKTGTGDGEGEFWWPFPGLAGGQQRIGMNGQLFLGGTNTLNDGLWHHLPVVYDQAAGQSQPLCGLCAGGFGEPDLFERDWAAGRFVDRQLHRRRK